MALYVFRCPRCNRAAEFEFPMSTGPSEKPRCPACGGDMKRTYTPPVVRITGDGGGGVSQSKLGNQHTPERDHVHEMHQKGELPYGKDDLQF